MKHPLQIQHDRNCHIVTEAESCCCSNDDNDDAGVDAAYSERHVVHEKQIEKWARIFPHFFFGSTVSTIFQRRESEFESKYLLVKSQLLCKTGAIADVAWPATFHAHSGSKKQRDGAGSGRRSTKLPGLLTMNGDGYKTRTSGVGWLGCSAYFTLEGCMLSCVNVVRAKSAHMASTANTTIRQISCR